MRLLGVVTYLAAALVLFVCVGLVYVRGGILDGPRSGSATSWLDPMSLYFGAKGVFCAVALILLYHIYREIASRNR